MVSTLAFKDNFTDLEVTNLYLTYFRLFCIQVAYKKQFFYLSGFVDSFGAQRMSYTVKWWQ
jgi:hypothetical protein